MAVNIPKTDKPRIVIIGGGFAGVNLVKGLKKADAQVVLIDKHNYHTFQPLLYQVATAGLEPDSIAYPLRKIFSKQSNFIFRMAEVIHIHSEKKCIETSIGNVEYDEVILAMGTSTNYFGMEDMQKNAMPMKFVPEALDLRSLLLQNCEAALLTRNKERQDALLNFVIIGGGPTGVELAGALAELKTYILPRDYPELDLDLVQIYLMEMMDQVLKPMTDKASEKAEKYLKEMGVHVLLNTAVKSYDGKVIVMKNGETIKSMAVIWAAGVSGAIIPGLKKDSMVKGDRYKVDQYNLIEGYNNIHAIGDIAAMQTENFPKGHPQLAPVAIQQGRHLAKNLIRKYKGNKMIPFKYQDKGAMATIGKRKAVADLPHFKSQGNLAWFIWLVVHIVQLIGFRNKLVVLIDWAWNYLNYDKAIRLIIRPFKRK